MEEVKEKKVQEVKEVKEKEEVDNVFPDAESWAKQERLGEGSTWEK